MLNNQNPQALMWKWRSTAGATNCFVINCRWVRASLEKRNLQLKRRKRRRRSQNRTVGLFDWSAASNVVFGIILRSTKCWLFFLIRGQWQIRRFRIWEIQFQRRVRNKRGAEWIGEYWETSEDEVGNWPSLPHAPVVNGSPTCLS